MPNAPTKQQLIEALRQNGEEAVRKLRATPESAFAEGVYENGWNARQILAHVASRVQRRRLTNKPP